MFFFLALPLHDGHGQMRTNLPIEKPLSRRTFDCIESRGVRVFWHFAMKSAIFVFAEKPDRKIGERLLRPGIEKLAIAFCAHGRKWYHVICGTARPGAGMPQPRGAKAKTRYRFSGTAWIFNSHQLSHRRVAGFPHVNSWGCPSPEGDHPLTRANAMNTLFGLTDTGGCQNSPGQARQIEVFGGLEILIVFGGYVAE